MGYKRFFDSAKLDLPCKKQAVEVSITKPGIITSDSLPLENLSAYELVMCQYMDWLVGSETKPANSTERSMSTSVEDGSNAKKIDTDVQSKNDSFGGVSNVKVSQANDSDNVFVEHNLGMSMNQHYTKGSETTFLTTKQPYGKEDRNVTFTGHSHDIGDAPIKSVGSTFGEGVDNAIKKTQCYCKGYFNAELFGSYQDVMDALAKPVSSYSLLYEHPSVQRTFTPISKKKVKVLNCKAIVRKHPVPKSGVESKKSTWKEANRFPTNVRSLIATGMLDGVAVRYVFLSQEKLRGVIKGSGYLCGCDSCNFSKTLNAYEFERHAGCKTSHPNNHVRFANGKTIHQIVQELKCTPDNMLFDAIQTATGSPINQSAFLAWKESYQAATRKLQPCRSLNFDGNTRI